MRKIHLKATALIAAASVALLAAAPALAGPFLDNFDGYGASVPWNGAGGWTTGGSVDLVASGTYGLTCVGGTGNCVDLSGSSPGSMSHSVFLNAGTYQLSFDYTGNQLGTTANSPYAETGFDFSLGSFGGSVGPLANNSSIFTTYANNFTVGAAGTYMLTFTQQGGGDNYRGSILDNVSISSVPEPATWAMMFLGFGMVGFALRRRRQEARVRFAA
jgi:hypothetical protein